MRIYFDHSATTPVDKEVLKRMHPYFIEEFGNPSSIHNFGQAALAGVDRARSEAANFLDCDESEIIFTSGATEADNLAIKGYLDGLSGSGRKYEQMHIITSLVEHDAVLEPFMEMEANKAPVTYIKVKKNGVIDLEKLKSSLTGNTVLVSVMWVNSEVGAVMPIREIGKTIKKFNEKRLKEWQNARTKDRGEKPLPVVFHVDATQAVNFINCGVKWNYIDMLSLSGHKIYGPKGVGLLYKKKGLNLKPIQTGGHQEGNFRSGTLNSTAIVGLGAALSRLGKGKKGEPSAAQMKNNRHIARLRDLLVEGVRKNVPDVVLNTDRENSVPSHAHFSFLGVEGESLLMALDLEGIAVSTGSACASGSLKASHVLLAMGIGRETAHYSIRFTLGKHNTKEEIAELIKKLPLIVKNLRNMNPIYKK